MSSQANNTSREDVAIVGMACVFPGADTAARFWQNVVNRVDSVGDPPPGWRADRYLDPEGRVSVPLYTARGGYLGDLSRFGPARYGVLPAGVEGAEPDHFIALRCAYEALADAGVPELPLNRAKTAVILGRGSYLNRGMLTLILHGTVVDQVVGLLRQLEPRRSAAELDALRAELKRHLPPLTAETMPGLAHSVLVGRIANRLDLMGPAYTLDAACSSSLLAVEHGIRELRSGTCDAVLAGGVQVSTPALLYQAFCQIEALSRTGKVAPFSSRANGTLLGEGCGILVLKRRGDAERDGNRIYALIKAVGVSSDGRGAGLLAPRSEGQQLAMRRAYEEAGFPPSSVGLLEAHGTGIALGDRTELQSLLACFGPRVGGTPTVALGSVKSMIGHLIPASGAASLMKTALALYHRTLPPTLHAEEPNPALGLEHSPFYLSTRTRPWVHGEKAAPRRAAVDAFGFGGINAHALLEEHPVHDESALARLEDGWPVELVVLSAADPAALRERARALAGWLGRARGVRLLDVAASLAGEAGPCRLAVVAAGPEELARKLEHAAKVLAQEGRDRIQDRSGIFWYREPLARNGRLAFVFPGEGAQYPGMLAELCRHFPEVRRQFDLTDSAFLRLGVSPPLSRLVFPPPEEEESARATLLNLEGAVVAVAAAGRALLALLGRLGVRPDAVVGHSSGEFGALLAAGAFVPADEDELVRSIAGGVENASAVARSGLAPEAVLTAVGGVDRPTVEQALAAAGGTVEVAIDNCPLQLVLVGDEGVTAAVLDALRGKGGLSERLPWGRAYHTPRFGAAARVIDEYYQSLRLGAPAVELWSCATAERYPHDPAAVRELAVRQWSSPVRFRETVEAMYAAGVRVFVEVGPRGNLCNFIADTLGKRPHAAVPLDSSRRNGIEQLCRAVGMLVAHGVAVDLPALYRARNPRLLDLTADPPAPPTPDPALDLTLPELTLGDQAVASWREGGRAPAAGAARTTDQLPGVGGRLRPQPAAVTPAAAPGNGRAAALADHQRTMRLFLETQERVTVAHFAANARRAGGLPRGPAPNAPPGPNGATNGPPRAATPPGPPAAFPARQPRAPADPAGPPPAAPAPPPPARRPFLERVLVHEADHRLVAECELDVARHPFLKDHTFFGRRLSVTDPTLAGLPVMPLAMTLELLAEAAAALRPELSVVAVRDVRTLRWLAFEAPSRRVRMEATARPGGEVHAILYEADTEGAAGVVAEATFELAAGPDLGGPAVPDTATTPFGRPQDEVYGWILLNGPSLRGIVSLDACDPHGARAALREPDPGLLLPADRTGELVLPAGLIDLAGQLVGVLALPWHTPEEAFLFYPNNLRRLEWARPPGRGAALRGVSRADLDGAQVHSHVEITTESGEVVLRVLDWTHERVRLPSPVYFYWSSPRQVRLSQPVGDCFRDVPGAGHCAVCLAGSATGKLLLKYPWAHVLARMVLGAEERRAFAGLKLPPVPTASWLLGRVAAKDAVRLQAALDVCLADVAVVPNEHGRPTARGAGTSAPLLSVAHTGLTAVAVAADADEFVGVGVDVEPREAMDAGVVEDAFGPEERALLDAAGEGTDAWYRSAWGAKEAVGKALGRGVLGGPRSIELVGLDAAAGRMHLALRGPMAEAFPEYAPGGRGAPELRAWARGHGEHVIVLCLLPRG